MIRPTTQQRIDSLHEQIAALIESEKAHHDKTHPSENELRRHISHTRIEMARHCPKDRENMRYAVAAMHPAGGA